MGDYIDFSCKECGKLFESVWIDDLHRQITIHSIICPDCVTNDVCGDCSQLDEAWTDGYNEGRDVGEHLNDSKYEKIST